MKEPIRKVHLTKMRLRGNERRRPERKRYEIGNRSTKGKLFASIVLDV